jgi:hypothetical protein
MRKHNDTIKSFTARKTASQGDPSLQMPPRTYLNVPSSFRTLFIHPEKRFIRNPLFEGRCVGTEPLHYLSRNKPGSYREGGVAVLAGTYTVLTAIVFAKPRISCFQHTPSSS